MIEEIDDSVGRLAEQLQALAETAREDLGDSPTNRKGKGVREPGRLASPRP